MNRHAEPNVPGAEGTKPFLKWVGSKRALLPVLSELLPRGRLIEPFAGAAAVALGLHWPACLLNDINRDLITVYKALQHQGEHFIERCRAWFRPENLTNEAYRALRLRFNESRNAQERASLFVYLNRHGYNGLCRYSAGRFNVPWGKPKKVPYFPEQEMLRAIAKLRTATLQAEDFEVVMRGAGRGDTVYCDPPYAPSTLGATFTAYAGSRFSWDDQARLVEAAQAAAGRGAVAAISNHDTGETRTLYRGATLHSLAVRRSVGCDAASRRCVPELIAVYRRRR